MHLIPVLDEGLGNSAYLLDLGDGRALAVDPSLDLRRVHEVARRQGLRIAYTVETHLHADFLSGVRLVWFVDPDERTVQVFTALDQCIVIAEEEMLDGGDVLPGLSLPLKKLFARLPSRASGKARKRRKGG